MSSSTAIENQTFEEFMELVNTYSAESSEVSEKFLLEIGYENVRQINGRWYGVQRVGFNVGVMCNLSWSGPDDGRICFQSFRYACEFLANWDGIEAPVVGKDGCAADKRTRIYT